MKGRKPGSENVVPLKPDEGGGSNFEARAKARAAELRPEGLSFTVGAIWDRLAPPLCDPRKDRLNAGNVFMFELLCHTIERHERLRVDVNDSGETYESETRNGKQQKSRPEVGQLNETWRQIRALASDFGMTPAADRGLQGGGQLGFSFQTTTASIEVEVPASDYAADPVTAWAADVLRGDVVAGPHVRNACRRHLLDLRDGPARGLVFDVDEAKSASHGSKQSCS